MRSLRPILVSLFVLAMLLTACGASDAASTEISVEPDAAIVADSAAEVDEPDDDEAAAEAPAQESTVVEDPTAEPVATEDPTAEPVAEEDPAAEAAASAEQQPPVDGERPARTEGRQPPADGGQRGGQRGGGADNTLASGPTNVGEHGPLSNADANGDEVVTRAELDSFIAGNPQRDVGLMAFFAESDIDGNNILDESELAVVDPATAFNGTDANEDGLVSFDEANAYANEEGRTYRAMGLSAFFDLVDSNGDEVADIDEIEAAHVSGLLARF